MNTAGSPFRRVFNKILIKGANKQQNSQATYIPVSLVLAKNRNFDRNPSRGCNFDLEGGAVLDLRGCIVFSMPSGSIL